MIKNILSDIGNVLVKVNLDKLVSQLQLHAWDETDMMEFITGNELYLFEIGQTGEKNFFTKLL